MPYTLSLHDALPILPRERAGAVLREPRRAGLLHGREGAGRLRQSDEDRKSTRLNSSHDQISYAVFCLKKKNNASKTILLVITKHLILRLQQVYDILV